MVKIGKAMHEARENDASNTEIAIDNIKLDKLTKEYLTEIKKSDADIEAGKWQLIYYLKILKDKGITRKGKLEIIEKNKSERKVVIIELTDELEEQLSGMMDDIARLVHDTRVPPVLNSPGCKKCAYYEYCYI